MTYLLRFYRWLHLLSLLREQVRDLHKEVRELRAVNEEQNRALIETEQRMYEAHELLLEHDLYCLPSWGESR